MRVENIVGGFLPKANTTDAQLVFGLDKDQWLKTITVGQVLKGKILRTYSDNKYGVSFGGKERIVDSAVPLSTGETLTGRVVGINEQVISIRLVQSKDNDAANRKDEPAGNLVNSASQIDLQAEQFKINLNPEDRVAIVKASKFSEAPEIAIRIGLYLVKLGLPVSTEMIRTIASRIVDNELFSPDQSQEVPILTTAFVQAQELQVNTKKSIEGVKEAYEKNIKPKKDHSTDRSDLELMSSNEESSEPEINDRMSKALLNLFNIDTGGTSQHKLQTLPIMINGKLMEFDVAFFDQAEQKSDHPGLRSRAIQFSLGTDYGKLGLLAQIVNNSLSISFSSDNDFFVEELAKYEADLLAALTDAGWDIGNIKYKSFLETDMPTYAVVNHVLQQDSLDISV